MLEHKYGLLDEVDREIIRQCVECNANYSEVARRLKYHRNTIVYHAEIIKDITGLDPKNFKDLIKLSQTIEKYPEN